VKQPPVTHTRRSFPNTVGTDFSMVRMLWFQAPCALRSSLKQCNQSKDIFRLVLGTAQPAINYGIANKSGRSNSDLAKEIVQTTWENGIREYDTAQGYGEKDHIKTN
jgi:hypothetical protein